MFSVKIKVCSCFLIKVMSLILFYKNHLQSSPTASLLSVFPSSVHVFLCVHSAEYESKKKTMFFVKSTRNYRIYQQTKDIFIFFLFLQWQWRRLYKGLDKNMGIMRVILISWGAFVIKLHFYSNTLFKMECRVFCTLYNYAKMGGNPWDRYTWQESAST